MTIKRDNLGRFVKGSGIGHKPYGGFNTRFKKGYRDNVGKRWKIKDTRKMGGIRYDKDGKSVNGFQIGNKIWEGRIGYWKGKKMSIATREKMGNAHRGEKSYNWKGGKEMRIWRRNKNRRARKNNASGSHTIGEWENLKTQYNFTCPCCHKREPEIKLTEDHIIPISRGGSDNIENIQPLCRSCNAKKHTKTIRYVCP